MNQPMNAIILCGGLSTRLGDMTKDIPKILLEMGGKTVLEWQVEKLKTLGVSRVVLAAGHLSDALRRKVGTSVHGVEMVYAVEPDRLGTGGAIAYALRFVPHADAPTWALNGDVLTAVDLADMLSRLLPESDGILLGSRVPDVSQYGTLLYSDAYELLEFREKEGFARPGFINGGVYLFTPHAKKYFSDDGHYSVEYDVFPRMKKLYVYESDAPWIDIGVPERLAWAQEHWREFDD